MRITLVKTMAAVVLIALTSCDQEERTASRPAPGPETVAAAPSPAAALERLKAGNARFAAGKSAHPRLQGGRRETTAREGQHPCATVLGCSDSRAPVELVFDQGIGDLFVVRVAGNVSGTDEAATIEYGVGHLHTPLCVVLGHTQCGAVTAVCEGAALTGLLAKLVDNIQPAVAAAKRAAPELAPDKLVAAAIEKNVWQSIADLLRASHEVRELVAAGKLTVAGAVYDLETGRVAWLGEHPEQKRLLAEGH